MIGKELLVLALFLAAFALLGWHAGGGSGHDGET